LPADCHLKQPANPQTRGQSTRGVQINRDRKEKIQEKGVEIGKRE